MRKLMINICIIGGLISCNDSTTDSNPPFKHPKEMTWTADTLSPAPEAIQLMPVDLIAFDHDDIWIACWSDVARRVMWHFNGSSWIDSDIQGQSGPIGLSAIAGFSSHDLWAGGFYGYNSSYYAALSHFNGLRWSKTDLNIEGEILDMTTDEEGNIWACGRNGVVLKYSQSSETWSVDTIKIFFPYSVSYFLKSIQQYNNKIFILATSTNQNTLIEKYFFISGNIDNWAIEDSMTLDSPSSVIKWGYRGLYASDFNKLYSFGLGGIWEYQNGTSIKIKDVNGAINDVYGINEDYLFAVGDYKKVLFYDGALWINLSQYLITDDPTFTYWRVWTNGYQTVIAGYGNVDGITKTIVWRGR
ncbi:hypothetical protein MROS_1088 [Melioribacter roseus P3M-2]|uniref:Photosynthesis system II assembly factor Ycf48/Hcf136-like domain-containing protein n=1 Tax=Melioribacter roseus (strain DSM 23840 / JCM 17771 / VKM B-2668 / P3M-2) TaxID=1191523 RepID=I6YUT0_MELRP|nr:hypothetical protein [Melioribacter roseus]AFN74327.1 hypothetical protein MROS_1088 [Melioribacter roseus P3M-2]